MGVMVYSLPWVMQDLCHQRYQQQEPSKYQPPKCTCSGMIAVSMQLLVGYTAASKRVILNAAEGIQAAFSVVLVCCKPDQQVVHGSLHICFGFEIDCSNCCSSSMSSLISILHVDFDHLLMWFTNCCRRPGQVAPPRLNRTVE